MGLLGRVIGNSSLALDPMGTALSLRLQSLPTNEHTPYTALSLLKTFFSFQYALLCSLDDAAYTSYAFIGLEHGSFTMDRDLLFSKETMHHPYFLLDPKDLPPMEGMVASLAHWAFPLGSDKEHDEDPWEAFLIIGTDEKDFLPELLALLLNNVEDKMLLGSKSGFDLSNSTLKSRLQQFQNEHGAFHCILFENYETESDGTGASTYDLLSAMVPTLGMVIPLPDERPLILLPKKIDRDLVVHRLSKSINSQALDSFEAAGINGALNRITAFY